MRLPAFEALRQREFRLICYGQLFGTMGTWMDEVARSWLIYELTDSVVQLGLVRGVQAIPFLLLSPLAGSAADRYSRKTQLVFALAANVLIYAGIAWLIFTGEIRPWHVYVSAVLIAIVQVFQQPARSAMIADVVPRAYITNAIGLISLFFNVARSTAPAVAGVVIAAFGTGNAFFLQAVMMFLATIPTLLLRPQSHAAKDAALQAARRESFGRSIIEGWRFSWKKEEVRAGLLCTMIASLFIVPFTTLLPVFARDLLEVGANGQGLMLTAMGIGALCSAVLITSAGERMPRGLFMLGSAMVYGVVIVLFSASTWFEFSLLLMGIAGMCHVHSNGLVQTVIQTYSSAEFRGRTIAVFNMHQAVITAGSLLLGALSFWIGARWAVACMGVAGTLAMILLNMSLPRARHIR